MIRLAKAHWSLFSGPGYFADGKDAGDSPSPNGQGRLIASCMINRTG